MEGKVSNNILIYILILNNVFYLIRNFINR